MKKRLAVSLFAFLLLMVSCSKDKDILNTLNDYNLSMESEGYHFGDKIKIPKEVLENAESISISFGEKETADLTINPEFFSLGDNAVTFNIKTKNGKILPQDATINVFAKNPEVQINYKIINEYPHNTEYFTEGFELHGNIIYESIGLNGKSKLIKYNLGSIVPILEISQPDDIFSEGITVFGDKIYQLTYQNRKGFIYDSEMKLLKEFEFPAAINEGWGMTNDGKNLIVSDGTKNIYFLNPENPSEIARYISIAGHSEIFDKINELEYRNGFIYANVWHKPIILKINPKTGEVVGTFDFTKIAEENNTDENGESVLNGIAFKGENMLITGKNWVKIYEVSVE
ncbi:MAG: glutaminyl-peptide cyclotransferase [Flavobacteriaceae bacterium]|jgi:glutamine cyclotransferase|nr:glutaminyl-peptide cyclotransferase [Flavobacteriaceae bacterium]